MTSITPMYPTDYHQLGTFRKERPVPYSRFFIAWMIALAIVALMLTTALSGACLVEIERRYASEARV